MFLLSCDNGGGISEVEGCTDTDACNYDVTATVDNGNCTYLGESFGRDAGPPECLWDCSGICDWGTSDPSDDPIDFCEWLYYDVGIATTQGCTSDCGGEITATLDNYVEECATCLLSEDENSDACQNLSYDY